LHVANAAAAAATISSAATISVRVSIKMGTASLSMTFSANSTVGTLSVDDDAGQPVTFPIHSADKFLSLRIIADHSILEIFAQGGRIAHTHRMYSTPMTPTTVSVMDAAATTTGGAEGGSSAANLAAKIARVHVYELKKAAPDPALEALARQLH
jgi:sucrose-6-phosphate hydrolase SacC (GH32 family)